MHIHCAPKEMENLSNTMEYHSFSGHKLMTVSRIPLQKQLRTEVTYLDHAKPLLGVLRSPLLRCSDFSLFAFSDFSVLPFSFAKKVCFI